MTVGQTIRIALDLITTHTDFDFRGYIDRPHLRDLRQVLTNNTRKLLDPLIVWQDADGCDLSPGSSPDLMESLPNAEGADE